MESRKTILIVDDTAMFRELEALFLSRLGEVVTAGNGAEGLVLARRLQPDVVVVDIDMPDMDGETLCRAIKADRDLCATPVILVTSGDSPEDHARAVRAHADDVLAKPLSRIQLGLAVSRLMRDRATRGLARVPVESDVRVRLSRVDACSWGVVRDLSRGGVFVESAGKLPVATEVYLDFRLPDGRLPLRPSAQVIWAGCHSKSGARGMGLRFLSLDRSSTERIDAYVHERSVSRSAAPASGTATG